MPKKLYPSEPPVIFQGLYKEFLEDDQEFLVKTVDPAVPTFAQELIDEHYPPQSELPLT